MVDDKVFRVSASVRGAWVSPALTIKPPCLLDVLQMAADRVVEDLHLTMTDMLKLGVSWMVHRYDVELARPLMDKAPITVETWHKAVDDLFTVREFCLLDGEGKTVGTAVSSWILVDVARRRPVRLSRHVPEQFITYSSRPARLIRGHLPPLSRIDSEEPVHVRLCDLDMNGHVNNTSYAAWMTEGVPDDVFASCGLVGMTIEFLHEVTRQSRPVCRSGRDGLEFCHELTDESGRVFCRGRTKWQKLLCRK